MQRRAFLATSMAALLMPPSLASAESKEQAALIAALDFKALDPDLVELEYSPATSTQPTARVPDVLPQGCELVLAYTNQSGQIDQAARAFATAHAIRLLAPRD